MTNVIVGQGLAGSTLALELLSRGEKVCIVDSPSPNTSTSVAAGLINPVVLKRMNLVWRADEFMECQSSFYSGWSEQFKVTWLKDTPVYRRFASVHEQNQWSEYSVNPKFKKYLDPEIGSIPNHIQGDFGMGRVIGAGWFDTSAFLGDCRVYFNSLGIFHEANWEYDQVMPSLRRIGVELTNARLIFCDGAGARHNLYFPTDAIRPSKGELLRIRTDEKIGFDGIIKAGVFVLPIGNNEYRVGATYDHHNLTEGVSEKGQRYLEDQLDKIFAVPYEIIGREWGIRPTTKDRRPILGKHPDQSGVYFFNGLGSRGVLMAPLLAKELCDLMLKGKALRPDVDVNRFY